MLPLVGRLMTPGSAGGSGAPFTPADLGASLLGWLVADDLTPGLVASWVDRVASYDFTGAGDERPTASATSYNGSPGVTFDGTGNFLTLASTPFPTGGTASVIWAIVDQTALAADVTARGIFGYGGDTNNGQRRLYRSVTTGQNRPFVLTGSGAANSTATLAADFSGRHYVRGNFGASSSLVNMDGVSGSSTAVTPNTGTSRSRIGAFPNSTAAGFFQGVIREILVTTGLTAGQVTQMNAYLAGRV